MKSVEQMYEEMVEIYGDKLPDPDHFPKTFQYYVNLYKYYHLKQNENDIHDQ